MLYLLVTLFVFSWLIRAYEIDNQEAGFVILAAAFVWPVVAIGFIYTHRKDTLKTLKFIVDWKALQALYADIEKRVNQPKLKLDKETL